jgi:hypothetical protein
MRNISPVKRDPAGDDPPTLGNETEHGATDHGLARPGLADQANRLRRADPKVNAAKQPRWRLCLQSQPQATDLQ